MAADDQMIVPSPSPITADSATVRLLDKASLEISTNDCPGLMAASNWVMARMARGAR
jgi:hypothetical protein